MTLHHTTLRPLTSDGPVVARHAGHLRLRLRGPLGLWLTVGMPLVGVLLAGAMTAAMWSERRHAPMAVFLVVSLLFALVPVRCSSLGYVEDRGSLGQRNGLLGGFSWIDLDDVVAVGYGRQVLPPIRYLVLWSKARQSDRAGARVARFASRMPRHLVDQHESGGELHPFRIDWALLGRRNSRLLLCRLRRRGLAIDDGLLPRHLRRSDR